MKGSKQFFRTTVKVFKIYLNISPFLTVGILITSIILNLQGLANAYVFAVILDKIIAFVGKGNASPNEILPLMLIFGAVDLVSLLVSALNGYCSDLLFSQDVYKLRLKQVDFMATLGISQMENPELTNKSTRYGEIYQGMGQQLTVTISLFSLLVAVVTSGLILTKFQPWLMVLFLILFLFKYANNARFRNRIWYLSRDTTEERRNAWSSAGWLADPAGMKEILISGGGYFLRSKFLSYVETYYAKYKHIRTRWSYFEILQAFLDVILFSAGIYLLIEYGLAGALSVGLITFYIRTLVTFSDQIDTLSYRLARAIESSIRIQDALEFFDIYEPEIDGTETVLDEPTPPLIEIKDLTFSYPTSPKPVLKNLSITIKPGEKVAIVGENGAGKTTFVKLLTRIYRPQGGVIHINSLDLNKISSKSWYKKLGVLFQDFNSYGNLTVNENIGIGKMDRTEISEKEVIEALKKANAYDFVQKYPKKSGQILSERFKGGIRPSGGQWQKLSIARFFYRNAPILILDEPTASIDAISEAQIFDNIYKFMKGKTVIIISHRFSTVRNADRIIVLDKGKIIEDGSHEVLLAKDGKYAKSFKLQAKGYS